LTKYGNHITCAILQLEKRGTELRIIISLISWGFIILGVIWILLFYLTPLKEVMDFLIQGIIITLAITILTMIRSFKYKRKVRD